jgi:hypothetical protein
MDLPASIAAFVKSSLMAMRRSQGICAFADYFWGKRANLGGESKLISSA